MSYEATMEDKIPNVYAAQQTLKRFYSPIVFPRLADHIKQRIARQFPSWNQCMPDIMVQRNDSSELRQSLDNAGRQLPLALVGQICYGHGAGHPYFGIHRDGRFLGEETHTYIYHALPGKSLKNGQAADYFRIDNIRRKPCLYASWILTRKIANRAADEIHRRWHEHRYMVCNEYDFDCASFVTDIAKHVNSISYGDPNNPFTFSIPSNTIKKGRPEERGMRAILRNTHRPPAILLFMLDPVTYEAVVSNGYRGNDGGWVICGDNDVFNVRSQ